MRKFPNPFYVVVGIVGAAFTATVGAFVLAATWDAAQTGATDAASASSFWPNILATLDRHGVAILAVQLVLLAAACVAAMASDKLLGSSRQGRAASGRVAQSPAEPHGEETGTNPDSSQA